MGPFDIIFQKTTTGRDTIFPTASPDEPPSSPPREDILSERPCSSDADFRVHHDAVPESRLQASGPNPDAGAAVDRVGGFPSP